jgi:eukaryotic-like serine/threonine-protein kinase
MHELDLSTGQVVSHYRVLDKLGGGGMGVVFKAEDTRLRRFVALKFLSAELAHDPVSLERFSREAQAASALNHPNICTIYDIDEQQGRTFIAMEFLDGNILKDFIASRPLNLAQVLDLSLQITDGLGAAHQLGIVHRDIKPANIFVTKRGHAKILDFGLAKLTAKSVSEVTLTADDATAGPAEIQLTRSGSMMGTAAYMSPEQIRGEVLDARTDLFSFGIVLYEMATGHVAFQGTTTGVVMEAILNRAPEPLRRLVSYDGLELDRIVTKALQKDRNRRYQSAADLHSDLLAYRSNIAATSSAQKRPSNSAGAGRSAPTSAEELNEKRHRLAEPSSESGAHQIAISQPWLHLRATTGAVVAAILLLIVLGIALNLGGLREKFVRRPGPPRIDSLAVLPLENLSRDPDQEYFADGMTEALITDLAKIGALKVISRTSVMQYKASRKPLRVIAQELGVDGVVEGSVARSGDRVRITAQLIDGKSDRHLWADSYDRNLRDVLALQDEVARAIATEIQVKLTPQQEALLTNARSLNPEAHDAYLLGRYYWNKSTEEGLKKAIAYFNQAIEKEPGYAEAYSGLAESYVVLGDFEIVTPKENYPRAEAAASKALELDDTLAEAHAAQGLVRLEFDRNWVAAEREFKRAIELNPSYPTAHQFYSWYLIATLRYNESIAEARRALELDPLSIFRIADLGVEFQLVHRADDAILQSQKALELDPNLDYALWALGLGYMQKRESENAIIHLQKAVLASGSSPRYLASLGYAFAVAGRTAEARSVLDKLRDLSQQRYVSPYYTATVYAGMGNPQAAVEYLERAYQERDGWIPYIQAQPEFDHLRADPRFQALVSHLNFPR